MRTWIAVVVAALPFAAPAAQECGGDNPSWLLATYVSSVMHLEEGVRETPRVGQQTASEGLQHRPDRGER